MAKPAPVTVQQAAEILDCDEAHVRLLIRRGRIEAGRFGKMHQVNPASVAHYLKHDRKPQMGRPRKKKTTRRKKL